MNSRAGGHHRGGASQAKPKHDEDCSGLRVRRRAQTRFSQRHFRFKPDHSVGTSYQDRLGTDDLRKLSAMAFWHRSSRRQSCARSTPASSTWANPHAARTTLRATATGALVCTVLNCMCGLRSNSILVVDNGDFTKTNSGRQPKNRRGFAFGSLMPFEVETEGVGVRSCTTRDLRSCNWMLRHFEPVRTRIYCDAILHFRLKLIVFQDRLGTT